MSELKIAQRKRRKNNFWRCANEVGTKFGDGGTPVVERFAFTTGQEARAGREGKGVWGKGIPAPPERKFSKVGVWILSKIGSDFIQDIQHSTIF